MNTIELNEEALSELTRDEITAKYSLQAIRDFMKSVDPESRLYRRLKFCLDSWPERAGKTLTHVLKDATVESLQAQLEDKENSENYKRCVRAAIVILQ